MRPIKGYSETQIGGNYPRLTPGGYVIKITKVKDVADKNYLTIIYDVAEGSKAGIFKDVPEDREYLHHFAVSYRDEVENDKGVNLKPCREFMIAVDTSNGTKFDEELQECQKTKKDWNEQQLVGKIVGVIFGGREKISNRGNTYVELKLPKAVSADVIRGGKFDVPELEKLPETTKQSIPEGFSPLTDENLPF